MFLIICLVHNETGTGLKTRSSGSRRDHPQLRRPTNSFHFKRIFKKFPNFFQNLLLFCSSLPIVAPKNQSSEMIPFQSNFQRQFETIHRTYCFWLPMSSLVGLDPILNMLLLVHTRVVRSWVFLIWDPSLPSTKVAHSLSHSPLPALPIFELHGPICHNGAV